MSRGKSEDLRPSALNIRYRALGIMRKWWMMKLSTLSTELSTEKTIKTRDKSRFFRGDVENLSQSKTYQQEKSGKTKSYPQSYPRDIPKIEWKEYNPIVTEL